MSKLTETSRLRVEDFQEQKKWISPILEGYNSFLTQSIKLFNKGLTFADNALGVEHDFEFTFQTDALTFPQRLKWPYDRFSPKHMFVTYASAAGSSIPVVISWRFADDRFIELLTVYRFTTAPAIAALVAGTKYKIRVRVEP